MVSLQMIIIQIVGFYLITITMFVKSDCRMEMSSSRRFSPFGSFTRRTISLIECQNMTFENEPLFPVLLNYTNIFINKYLYIKIDENQLSAVSNITFVNSNVSLSSKTFENFTNLITLNLISNNLLTFDIAPIPSLRNLDLSHNSLTSLHNTKFQNFSLSSLIVSFNQLSSIYCLNVSTEINLSHNQLNDSCEFASSIKFIDLSYNNINFIDYAHFKDLKKLIKLDLSNNDIYYIGSQLEDLNELQYINLSHNSIKNIYQGSFEGLESLINLDLSYNQIEKIYPGATNDLEHLRYLNLSYNNLYDLNIGVIFYPMDNLKELKLVGNFLKNLDVITLNNLLKNLEYISLSFSEISCNTLMHYINELEKYNIEVLRGPIIYQHNVHGILCTPLNNTNQLENNFENAVYSIEKVHSLFIVIAVFFVLILSMLFVINYYRYKSMRRF